MNWQDLAATSHYQTATAVREKLADGNVAEAFTGIEELIESLGRADKRALRSQLIRLMAHVIKWKTEPDKRSSSWIATIENARIEIEELLEFEPGLMPSLAGLLIALFPKAKRLAESEMNQTAAISSLSAAELFTDHYSL